MNRPEPKKTPRCFQRGVRVFDLFLESADNKKNQPREKANRADAAHEERSVTHCGQDVQHDPAAKHQQPADEFQPKRRRLAGRVAA